ncbi:MAG: RNA polymerase sigma factor [Pseudomonadota bacterium]
MQPGQRYSEDGLADLFRADLDALYRYAVKLLRDADEAQDAVHDAFLRICGRGGHVEAPVRPRPWMFRVLRNVCIDRMRARGRRATLFVPGSEDFDGVSERTPETDLVAHDALAKVSAAAARLPAELGETLALVVVEQLSYQEAAFVMEVPVGTVRSRLYRARRLLRDCLNPADTEELVRAGAGTGSAASEAE